MDYIGTITILRQQRNRMGGVRKLAIFADFQWYLLGLTEKVQKCTDVILGWSHTLSKKNLLGHLYWGTQWTMEIS